MIYYMLDDDGNVIATDNVDLWGNFMESGKRQIALTHIGEVMISTVFLGIDHAFMSPGPPVVFETMCFWDGNSALDNEMYRYTSKEAALVGHDKMCERVRREILRRAKS